MATFWAAALDYTVDGPPGEHDDWMEFQVAQGFPADERVDFAAVTDPAGGGRICFIAVPEPKQGKNRLHLDIRAEQVDALVARLRDLGATILRTGRERGQYFVTMADIEGNEFCVH
ncbi:hypothetical protein EV193_10759 [Herbihabitans rhizosphaerae]|uniref:VOC domain-containing protein n=2 Tax=Herbihabitans rhizosphaerae TaxID=1872711 RepID=A0A4Q7KIK1_9PSEU|nr:hypothetical protein EV193_10759 [Herbihabitans rhizosphaerae]